MRKKWDNYVNNFLLPLERYEEFGWGRTISPFVATIMRLKSCLYLERTSYRPNDSNENVYIYLSAESAFLE